MTYRGRFAPTPNGNLHIGSLYIAIASWCDARANNGKWFLRFDNLDKERTSQKYEDNILFFLESVGLLWDEKIIYQNKNINIYKEIFEDLKKKKILYPCTCSKKEIISRCNVGLEGRRYDGHCFPLSKSKKEIRSYRVLLKNQNLTLYDNLQGKITCNIKEISGDFPVLVKDLNYAYQLASVVDDQNYKINNIIRGTDLIYSSIKQIYLQDLLDFKKKKYLHLPILCYENKKKISKQNKATSIDYINPKQDILRCLILLGFKLNKEVCNKDSRHILKWAKDNWERKNLPKGEKIIL